MKKPILDEKTNKEFEKSEFVTRKFGEDNDFIDVISEGTTADAIKSFLAQTLQNQKEQILKEVVEAFEDWYSRAWVREDIREKGGIGKRDEFTKEFTGILQQAIDKL